MWDDMEFVDEFRKSSSILWMIWTQIVDISIEISMYMSVYCGVVNWDGLIRGPDHRVGPGSVSGVEGVIGPEPCLRYGAATVRTVVKNWTWAFYSTSNCSNLQGKKRQQDDSPPFGLGAHNFQTQTHLGSWMALQCFANQERDG